MTPALTLTLTFLWNRLLLYDKHAGGLGVCDELYTRRLELLQKAHQLLSSCPCGAARSPAPCAPHRATAPPAFPAPTAPTAPTALSALSAHSALPSPPRVSSSSHSSPMARVPRGAISPSAPPINCASTSDATTDPILCGMIGDNSDTIGCPSCLLDQR